MLGGQGSSTSSAHDDPFKLLLGGGREKSSMLHMVAIPFREVANQAVYTWLLKGRDMLDEVRRIGGQRGSCHRHG
ncbi:hypothetical protein GBA52_024624 [Prunus armeniaca]|nr:hypothetical protein GBA52_024624 [Prunus armeniaca]